MITPEEFQELKEQIDKLKQDRDQAAGALKELRKRLQAEHGCKTVAEAKIKSKELTGKIEKLEKQYRMMEKEIKRKWGDKLT